MKSHAPGASTSEPEIGNIDAHGIWVCVVGREYFLPYSEYPWFKDATVRQIADVRLLHGEHLHWPALDVDLSLDSLERPEEYPLTAK